MQAASEVIVYSPRAHAFQCQFHGIAVLRLSCRAEGAQEQFKGKALRKLVDPAGDAAVCMVDRPVDRIRRLHDVVRTRQRRSFSPLVYLTDGLRHPVGVSQEGDALAPPLLPQETKKAREPRPPVRVVPWEIGARVNGLQVRSQEDAHRPAPVPAREEHGGGHVDLVKVRALLAVDLDRNEVAVEDLRHRLVLEGLVFHYVAPVAGGVADAQEDQLVLATGELQGLLAPGKPLHGVLGVLKQVRAGFARKPVGHRSEVDRHQADVRDAARGSLRKPTKKGPQ